MMILYFIYIFIFMYCIRFAVLLNLWRRLLLILYIDVNITKKTIYYYITLILKNNDKLIH